MKKTDKTYEELKDKFSHYGRDDFYNKFKNYFLPNSIGLRLAIDGAWGSGKTVLIEKMIDDLKKSDNMSCLYFNAWENDYFNSPLYAILFQLLKDDEFNKAFETSVMEDDKISLQLSFSYDYLSATMNKTNPIEEELIKMNYSSFAMDLVNKAIDKYLINKKNLIIFIDELDRCKPEFALELLEQFNHLNSKNLTFVYAINFAQLIALIKSVYGNEYDGETYLYKFFDEIKVLPKLDYENIFTYMQQYYPNLAQFGCDFNAVYESLNLLDFTYRDINRFYDYLPRIKLLHNQTYTTFSSNVYLTTLFILCLIRIKKPLLIRTVLSDKKAFSELGLYFNNFQFLLDLIEKEREGHSERFDNLQKIIETLFEDDKIINLLY